MLYSLKLVDPEWVMSRSSYALLVAMVAGNLIFSRSSL